MIAPFLADSYNSYVYRCDTSATPCTPDPCRHGTCTSYGTVHFECTCDAGYDGLLCDNNIGKLFDEENNVCYKANSSEPMVYMTCKCNIIQNNNSFFLAYDFCRFCVVIRFFSSRHNGQWPPPSKDFLSKILSLTFFFLS